MNVYQINDKTTGERIMVLISDCVKRARWAFYATKSFAHHGPVVVKLIKRGVKDPNAPVIAESATHQGSRVKARGQCEKCATETNWIVMVNGRLAYWCGCN